MAAKTQWSLKNLATRPLSELPSTVVAMAVYALIFWGIVCVIRIAMDHPSARPLTRSTREITPGGGERTTHTSSNG